LHSSQDVSYGCLQDHGLEFGEHNTVTGNRITYGSYSGILLGRQRHAIVSNNQILRPGESGIKTYQGSIAKVSRRCYAVSVIGTCSVKHFSFDPATFPIKRHILWSRQCRRPAALRLDRPDLRLRTAGGA